MSGFTPKVEGAKTSKNMGEADQQVPPYRCLGKSHGSSQTDKGRRIVLSSQFLVFSWPVISRWPHKGAKEGILAVRSEFAKISRKMKLPNVERAVVPGRKVTHYLLSTTHRDGQHKAAFFRSFGFKLEGWEELAKALLEHARRHEIVEVVPTPFGRNFVIEGALPAPDGRTPKVRAVWFIANGRETATLATAYPLDA
jgi:hypothetical protein